MYNRYVPQADGSYQKKRVQEPIRIPQPTHQQQNAKTENKECLIQESCRQPEKQERCTNHKPSSNRHDVNTGSFLKQLLPKDFDTGDLLVIILLLLMAGDCQEDRNTALLTLALYFIL